MLEENRRDEARGASRETRLLVLTLVLSGVVLVLLARFRFPDAAQRPTAPPATALDELATRAAFDAQAGALRNLARRLEGSLVHLRWRSPGGADASAAARWLVGLRIRDDLAVVGLPPAGPGQGALEASADSRWFPAPHVGIDNARGFAVVRVPARPAPVVSITSDDNRAPGFVAAARGGPGGPGLYPVWLATLAPIDRSAWNGPVWALPDDPRPSVGTLVFSIEGSLIGVVASGAAGSVLVPATIALGHAGELARGRSFTGADGGFAVLDLSSPALRAAAGRLDGALVGWIDPAGPSQAQLQTGDVVVRVDDDAIHEAADFVRAMARREAGTRATLTLVRAGQEQTLSIVLRPPPGPAAGTASASTKTGGTALAGLGLTLRRTGNRVIVEAVDPRGAAQGLVAPGDIITWVRGGDRLTPAAIASAYDALGRGSALLLRVATADADSHDAAVPERTVAILKP